MDDLADALRALDGRRVRVEVRRSNRIAELVGVMSVPEWADHDNVAREIGDSTLWLAEGELVSADADHVRVALPGQLEVMIASAERA
jgi:hypothetical protein